MLNKYLADEYGDLSMQFIGILFLVMIGILLCINLAIRSMNKAEKANTKFNDLVESQVN